MNWKYIIAGVLALALLAALRFPLDPSTGLRVGAAVATPAEQGRLVAAAGVVEPASEARELAATLVGRLTKVNFEEGEHVVAGAIIAEIENDDLKAQLAGAEAAVGMRASELARLNAGAREQERSEARAAVREADALAVMARSKFERQSALGLKQIASQEAVEQARADRDAADARRELLAQRLSLLVAPPRHEDVAIAQANLAAAKARVEDIEAQLEKTLIRSPLDGTVLKLYRRMGETVSNLPPTPIATVGDTSRLRIKADVDQGDVAYIHPGQIVSVTADGFPNQRFRGTVARVGAQLGRKNFRSDDPQERFDTKILEVLIDLEPGVQLPVGLPVDIKGENSPPATKLSDVQPARLRVGLIPFADAVETPAQPAGMRGPL